ncbi:CoA transferase subunit A [Oceanibacterium hippocampi]|uniref:3-oxoadipate CoA-transferase subunit A n=1 Tax=Oceanibacterium hippocampi TaxID=745714 RepID=A0A1Y5S0F8_9PROT|nr:CoA-transferase [Oceanibacterium hippocampi]SLN28771.1 3-oxoadipate CoA-transferase subunit A [Oceanibacterium hippocampi]
MNEPFIDLDALAAAIPDGAKLAIPTDYSGVAMAATRALVRRGVRDLHLVCVPTSGIQADILIGTGAVATLETSAITLGEYGPAPRFTEALKTRSIRMMDATCPAVHAGLQAAEKGLPFMPIRGILGSDLLTIRPDWRVIDDPFAEAPAPIVLVPAIRPDVALFHAPLADRAGNVWIGRRRELITMAHAAVRTLVTVERIVDEDFFADEMRTAGVLPSFYVDGIAEAPRGAWPLRLWSTYEEDEAALSAYAAAARSAEGFRVWLDNEGSAVPMAAE